MNAEQLEQKYNQLISDYNMWQENVIDAQSAVVEEVCNNGFASSEAHQRVTEAEEKLNDVDFELYCFKQDNASFVANLKAERKAKREAGADKRFEAFWNN